MKRQNKFTDEKTIPNQKAFEGSQKQYNNALENNKRIKEKVSKDIKKVDNIKSAQQKTLERMAAASEQLDNPLIDDLEKKVNKFESQFKDKISQIEQKLSPVQKDD
ncbi:hypothetical protein AB1I58_07300 [Enterococcus hirae]|uniref:hypothetical protein n=1 Tax=Enterococcus hirae TaxID=1354 RepID=UPI001A0AF67D|nr:hypothetical protein [Enterococcus hirae]